MYEQVSHSLLNEILDELKPEIRRQNLRHFYTRLGANFYAIHSLFHHLYGQRDDFKRQMIALVEVMASRYIERSAELEQRDVAREQNHNWFLSQEWVGMALYADGFAGNLQGMNEHITYLQELGINLVHVMPMMVCPEGASDGGYAVSDFRDIDPRVGSLEELHEMAGSMRKRDMLLTLDVVVNHTSDEHEWAQKAMAGEVVYQDYYLMFPDRTMPDQYERTVREIFPEFKSGSFTYYEQMDRWVWTTFNEFQWDLNYANPAVFAEMLDIMLYLANQGVEVLRLDAVAFMWKRMGTDCENQPEAHYILQAFRALSRIAAPALLLLAEAIVPPPQLVPYMGLGAAANKECEIAYHNVFMVMMWSSLAERKVALMTHALQQMPDIPLGASWLMYIRCHDDIGWAVTEENAEAVGLNGFAHRSFLSDFYNGRFPQTFARGTTFQFNPKTNDRRINGSLASLAGLEVAIEKQSFYEVDLAIERILLMHSLIFAFGGIPLIYMGDEVGLLNDRSYLENPDLANDSRWIHRPYMDWDKAAERSDSQSITGRIFQGICHLAAARKRTFLLHAKAQTFPVWTHNESVFGMIRESARGRMLVLANFTEQAQSVPRYRLEEMGFHSLLVNRLDENPLDTWGDVVLKPYQSCWLEKKG